MKLICPSCGAVHSVEAWRNDTVIRQCLKLTGDLPHAISSRCFAYLALFRPSEKSLQWKKVLRLLSELAALTEHAHIQWQKRPARPSSANIWGQALEQICENKPKRLPLKSHGYLQAIAYGIADDMDRQTETKRNQAERSGSFEGERTSLPDEEMAEIKKSFGKIFGNGE